MQRLLTKFATALVLCCALPSMLAVSQAFAQGIAGAYTRGDTTKDDSAVIVFLADGHYWDFEIARTGTCCDAVGRGVYAWNPATGTFTVTPLGEDVNGDVGLARLRSNPGTLTISGDTGTLTIPGFPTDILTRVQGPSPIVGAWLNGEVFAFLPNGVFFATWFGAARGTYTWDPTIRLLQLECPAAFGFANPDFCNPYLYGDLFGDSLALYSCCDSDFDYHVLGQLARISGDTTFRDNYQGLFWNAPAGSESGWGINLAHQGDVIFATWFTYDATGNARWLSMTANKTAENVFTGTLYRNHGPVFGTTSFSPAAVTATNVGTGTLTFSDANNGSFTYTVDGIGQTKAITRQVFGPVPSCYFGPPLLSVKPANYQNLWYAAPPESEAGWGVYVTHQGDTIFMTWFTYDVDGAPLWLSATTTRNPWNAYTGTLYRTTGPAFYAVPFLSANVGRTAVGTVTLGFASFNEMYLTSTVALNGPTSTVSQSKKLTRQVFRPPGTTCM